tara:strand:+ start:9449 stop:10786 length:1338 start_codon:yes stop_codon:yes gene_type:complete
MSLPTYHNYKESGFAWIGEIPQHWATTKFRYVFRESTEKIEDEVIGPMLSVSGYRGIEIKEYDDENQRRLPNDLVGYRIVRPGQLVVNSMWLNHSGLGISDFEGHVSPAYRSYYFNCDMDRRYAHHLMRSSSYVFGYTSFLTGIRPNSLQMSRDDLMGYPILVPTIEEQRHIAVFLDHETAKIDALVEEQRRLIELLKEKRQAVISHAVTKGLNPNAPMKDSGIEWLGEVPEHWEIKRLKFTAQIRGGVAKGRNMEGCRLINVPYIRVANVQDGYLDLNEIAHIEIAEDELERYSLRTGDVLMNEGGDFDKLGRGYVWNAEIEPCIHQNHVFAVRTASVNPYWLNLLTSSSFGRFYFMSRSKQSTNLASISATNIGEFPMPYPSITEQQSIVAYVHARSRQFDSLIEVAASAVTLLHQRRNALISAAVTGKIDVRNFTVKETEAA